MRRREFIAGLGSAVAAWPVLARAQQPAMQTIGYLSARAASKYPEFLLAFLQGLREAGYVEGQFATGSQPALRQWPCTDVKYSGRSPD
jgi:putative ABC transport system substrate-binding protein